jgi:ATP-dependent RNA helicase SUPV3L1/SUV3
VPAEPVLIEVWRPHRTNHHAQRRPEGRGPRRDGARPDNRRGPAQPAAEGAVAAEGQAAAGERRLGRPRPDHRGPGGDRRSDRDRRPQPAADGSPVQGAAEGAPAEGRAARPARDFNAPPRQGGGGKPRFEGRGGGDRGGPRRDGRRDEGRGPQNFSTETPRPAPRDRQPDPNSPFAKLMALKVEMERGKKES